MILDAVPRFGTGPLDLIAGSGSRTGVHVSAHRDRAPEPGAPVECAPVERRIPSVNPRALLAKYIHHVQSCESVDFLEVRHDFRNPRQTWTDEEWKLLQELREQEPPE